MNDRFDPRIEQPKARPALDATGVGEPMPVYEVPGDPEPSFDPFERIPHFRIIVVALCIVVAIASAWPLSGHFSSPETHAATIKTLDAKRDTVLGLTAASAGLSAAISAIPGDAGSPIAEKLMDVSADFVVVLAAIYLEKFLLTTLGFTSFSILFPIALACIAFWALARDRIPAARAAATVAKKLILMGIVLAFAVPASVFITNQIEGTYEQSIQNTIETANTAAADAEDAQEDEGDQGILEWLQSIPGAVVEGVSNVATGAQNLVNNFIDALAVMVVTSCVIPLLVLVFLLWAAKLVLGVNVDAPLALLKPRTLTKRPKKK